MEPFQLTLARLEYIKYITFGVFLLINIFTVFVVLRYAILVSNFFEIPIEKLIIFIEEVNFDNLEEENRE